MRNLLVLITMLSATIAFSRGFLVPKNKQYNPFLIKSHRVEAIIKNGAAKTIIKETFINPHNTDMEGIFVFPLPKGANVSLFRMKMKGKWVSGRVLEKNKARNIYNRIVSQMKDPGLIEYMGNDMFKASVYPIPKNGQMEIEITYTQTTKLTGNVYSYTYPLKGMGKVNTQRIYHYCGHYYYRYDRRYISTGCTTTQKSTQPISTKEDFTFTAKIESNVPIKSVYSPSHKLDIIKREKKVTIGFEKNKQILNKDIEIYYTVDKKDIGASILAYKPESEKNGYFMMMISPKSEVDKKEIENKNLLLVIDTSGSMSGEKMKYAKKALKYVVGRLNKGDKFNIIRFSSGVDYYKDTPVLATEENIKKALKYVDDLYASGGTAIDEALKEALKQADKELPNMIVFMTDGRPTVGETEVSEIVKNSIKNNTKKVKIFSFGIGDDLNAVLIDKISAKNGGVSDYIKPGAEIEAVISAFYDKVAFPVLTNIKLKISGVKTYDLYPYKIDDLFKGEELRVFGRYKLNGNSNGKGWLKRMISLYNNGKTATLTLTGNKKGKQETYEFNVNFKSFDNNDFIPNIWATKKVGFLLEEIRLNGENKELVDEVKRLATKFAIVTPYTSYLVTEKDKITSRPNQTIDDMSVGGGGRKVMLRSKGRGSSGYGFGKVGSARPMRAMEKEEGVADSVAFNSTSGSVAVKTSKKLRKMKKSDRIQGSSIKKVVGDKTFIFKNGIWTDNYMLGKKQKPIAVKLKYMSNLYLKLISKNTKIRKYLSVGKNVILYYSKYRIEVNANYTGKEILPKSLLK